MVRHALVLAEKLDNATAHGSVDRLLLLRASSELRRLAKLLPEEDGPALEKQGRIDI